MPIASYKNCHLEKTGGTSRRSQSNCGINKSQEDESSLTTFDGPLLVISLIFWPSIPRWPDVYVHLFSLFQDILPFAASYSVFLRTGVSGGPHGHERYTVYECNSIIYNHREMRFTNVSTYLLLICRWVLLQQKLFSWVGLDPSILRLLYLAMFKGWTGARQSPSLELYCSRMESLICCNQIYIRNSWSLVQNWWSIPIKY